MAADENVSIPRPEQNWRLGFWSLIATQFQGAFNDNGLKFFVIFLILGTHPTDSQKDFLVFVIGNLFALPFLLFSMAGGFLADRFSKRNVAIATKIFEVGAMLFAMYAFTQGNSRMAFAVIFLASTQAAFFGPAKYGLLPELLPDKVRYCSSSSFFTAAKFCTSTRRTAAIYRRRWPSGSAWGATPPGYFRRVRSSTVSSLSGPWGCRCLRWPYPSTD